MLESDIEKLILDYLNKSGVFAFKIKTTGTYDPVKKVFRGLGKFSLKGVSDILGVLPNGRFLAIEVKTPKGKPTVEQIAFINKVNAMGGLAFIARSIEEVKNGLAGKQ